MNQSCRVRSSRSECVGLSTVYQKTCPTPVASGPSVGVTPAGRLFADEAHALEHARPREIQIDAVLEDDVDHREAERRLRAHDAHAGEPLQVRRERIRDLVLDFLRAVPGPVGEDDDLVVGQIGNRVDRRGRQRPPAPAGEAEIQDDDDEPVPEREVDESIDHACLAEAPRRSVSEAGATTLVMPHAYTREPATRTGSEQTHDDCQWLDEEDGEQNVLRDRARSESAQTFATRR